MFVDQIQQHVAEQTQAQQPKRRKYRRRTAAARINGELDTLRKRQARLTRQIADAESKAAGWRARLSETERDIAMYEAAGTEG